ncbi:MAG: hypothetical protein R2875_01205 [Desulfobacterales bacterium]
MRTISGACSKNSNPTIRTDAIGRRIAGLNYFLVTDIDNTLIGDDNFIWRTSATCSQITGTASACRGHGPDHRFRSGLSAKI